MDIFKHAPTISEDTLQYKLYPLPDASDRASVTSLAAQIEALVQDLLPDSIWHRDGFELKVVPDLNAEDKWMMEGRMRVGDSVDDEWCVVWLLREVSKKWDVAISVFDSDGEFLLIEAADQLPHWVSPTNAENRVWIYRSQLHLISLSYLSPPSTKPRQRRQYDNNGSDNERDYDDDNEEWLDVQDALKALRSRDLTEASDAAQEAVWKRISGYPKAVQQHMHTAKTFLPVDIAKALSQNPSLVQRATETFYTRDAIQLRAAHRMSRFPPRPELLIPVRMTRTAYAQLSGQKFHPPKIFGQFKEREGTREWKWRDIGMKIACGFEMLYQESKARSESVSTDGLRVSVEARKDALRRNSDYQDYLRKLSSAGFFKGEVEGSKLWNELEDKAVDVFVNSRRDDDASRTSFATLINQAIARAGENIYQQNIEEQDDDWLTIDAESFDQKLVETVRPGTKTGVDTSQSEVMDVDKDDEESALAKEQAEKLQGLAKKIEGFVEGEGTLEGAVFDDDEMSEDDDLSEFSVEEVHSDVDEDGTQVIEEDLVAKAARQEAMEKLVPAIDPSEYGKMPASYYSNSQRTAPVTMETEMNDALSHSNNPNVLEPVQKKPIRRPILPRDDFDGVDSDDETDEEDAVGDESEEDQPQVVGDVEIDMQEEQEEFLNFAREALGVTDDMWKDIVRDRQDRGAFVPKGSSVKQRQNNSKGLEKVTTANKSEASGIQLRSPQSGPRPNVNPNLDSFEAVMEAMEVELDRARQAKRPFEPTRNDTSKAPALKSSMAKAQPASSGKKGKEKASVSFTDVNEGADDGDIEAAMDAELRAVLERDEDDSGDEEPMDYGLIKNFLESFKSQGGLSGPVSNLAGRLDPKFTMPRDDT